MVSARRSLPQCLRLALPLFLSLGLVGPLGGQAAEDKAEKPSSPPAQNAESPEKAPEASPAPQATNALDEAQTAYEREQRELQERLRDAPLWQSSHEQVRVLKVNEYAQHQQVHSFCLNAEGNLLVCCGGNVDEETRSLSSSTSSGAAVEDVAHRGEILLLSPEGKKLTAWSLPLEPQAICLASGGAIYVGGAGRLAKLDRDGNVMFSVDSPALAELPPLAAAPESTEAAQGEDSEAARKAKQEEIDTLEKKVREAQDEIQKLVQEAAKGLDPNDDAAQEAFRAKLKEPLEAFQELQEKLQDLTTTPEVRAAQLRMERERRLAITGLAVTNQDVFVACRSAKGYGYTVWRTDRDLQNPKKIVEKLAGCCGQMDIQARDGELWVAHNGRHKVVQYDRDGQKLSSFGKTDRTNADGFGGCCEPKNLRLAVEGEIFAAESGPPTCVKRFTTTGEFRGVAVVAPWTSGCVRVTTEYRPAQDEFFVLNSGERTIHVFARKAAEAPAAEKTPAE